MSSWLDKTFKTANTTQKEIETLLATNTLWYQEDKLEKVFNIVKGNSLKLEKTDFKNLRKEFKNWAENLYTQNKILLGKRKEGFNDNDRKAITTAVIHHTSTKKTSTPTYLSSIHLFTLYYPVYKSGFGKINKKPQPISSGHFYKGKQTFIGYHYLVYENGDYIKTLKDEYVGWHAGNYKVNCESIGIALVDDLREKHPTNKAIEAVNKILSKYNNLNVLGHRDVKKEYAPCPSNLWYKWKKEIVI
jgi:hypothetical protein